MSIRERICRISCQCDGFSLTWMECFTCNGIKAFLHFSYESVKVKTNRKKEQQITLYAVACENSS